MHREFSGQDGAFRIGPPVPGFDAMFDQMKVQLDGERLVEVAERIDALCHEALALFLCAPRALYAVNNHVSFGPTAPPWRSPRYGSTRSTGRGPGAARAAGSRSRAATDQRSGYGAVPVVAAPDEDRPGFPRASGNAC